VCYPWYVPEGGIAGGKPVQFYSFPTGKPALVAAPMIVPVMTYAEVELIKSELEFRAGKQCHAKTAYEKGVKAAIEQWGAVMPADYFNNANAAYNATLSRIMLQKYYALYFNDTSNGSSTAEQACRPCLCRRVCSITKECL
jgi:hypothetical protein